MEYRPPVDEPNSLPLLRLLTHDKGAADATAEEVEDAVDDAREVVEEDEDATGAGRYIPLHTRSALTKSPLRTLFM